MVPVHGLQQAQRADEVVVVVGERHRDGLSHGFEAGKVDDRVDGMCRKDRI